MHGLRRGGSMDEKTRQFVLDLLKKAHEGALQSVQSEFAELPSEGRHLAVEAMASFNACLEHRFEGTVPPRDAEERMAALIYGHPSPQVVHVMEHFARAMNELLLESRKRLASSGTRRDN